MRKHEELSNPASCLNKAESNEMTFVLLGRDPAAPLAVRMWVEARILLGLNVPDDPKLVEARACADTMSAERRRLDGR